MSLCPIIIYTPSNKAQLDPIEKLLISNNTSVTSKAYTAHSAGEQCVTLTSFNCASYVCCLGKNNLCSHHFNYYIDTRVRNNIKTILIIKFCHLTMRNMASIEELGYLVIVRKIVHVLLHVSMSEQVLHVQLYLHVD